MPRRSEPSGLPQEILDAIIDELQYDKKSLKQASLACKALCPRTRVHLFSVVVIADSTSSDRLRKLITLSPKLALYFQRLQISILQMLDIHAPAVYGPLTVIESLVNITHLSLCNGFWCHMPDTVVSSLQSRSYHTIHIDDSFNFRTMGEVCSLMQNSPDLRQVHFTCEIHPIPECHLDHSLHRTPAPVALHITDSQDTLVSQAPGLLKSALSSHPCPFSFKNIRSLVVDLSGMRAIVLLHLAQYLALPGTSLKLLHVDHNKQGLSNHLSSTTLDVSRIENIAITTFRAHLAGGSDILRWWISNLSAVNKHNVIRSVTITIRTYTPHQGHPALDWEDLWMRLDSCLTSYKMASLQYVAITFEPRPAEWDALKAQMEGSFLGLKQSGREVILDAVAMF
ncbi:uncharacterized protein EV420DRAFT_800329 [Desarmillaria tabescens]|uniref:F-box domain-containing protein n=1 Tax=Armillaria tabescens TaxID=1929756 RepID=A0AA39NHT9_ARMTA|nr:uncharacterized protein EV420DRAFT_800329 [Desarmillaria tabescens]KAK0465903.1 hypothetical protein EV420DRAFT_800329 [Desarmillaria tabescens]